MPPSRKPLAWFTPHGWVYRPVSLAGWLLTLIALLFVVQVVGYIWLLSRNPGICFFVSFPFVVSAGTLLMWVASKTSRA